MALYTAVALLFLLLPTIKSATIQQPTHTKKLQSLGEEALNHLNNMTGSALRPHTGSHSVGCIRDAKEHDRLNCSIILTFSSYVREAVEIDGLTDDTKLHNKLNDIRQRIEDLKRRACSNHPEDVCQTPFQDKEMSFENLEKLRSILVLFTKWFSKLM